MFLLLGILILTELYFEFVNVKRADGSIENGVRNERLIKYITSRLRLVP